MTVFREQLLPWPGHVHQHPNPVGRRNSRRTPSVPELLASPVVQQALNSAWLNSRVNDVRLYHEEGGWIYLSPTTGEVGVQVARIGTHSEIDLNSPPHWEGMVVVATYHTHPNRAGPGPDERDYRLSIERGVPGIIRAANGIHIYGLEARRGPWPPPRGGSEFAPVP